MAPDPAAAMGQGAVKEGSLEEGDGPEEGFTCFERSLRPCHAAGCIFVVGGVLRSSR